MQSVEDIAREIVQREGGYVDDPDDPGGATKYGVTIGTLRKLRLDLNKDKRVDRADVRALTREQAQKIFLDSYFRKPGLSQLPPALWASVFDMYVNAGTNAVKILQRLLLQMGHHLTVDGIIGPRTIAAAQSAALDAPEHLADAYGIARRNYYYALADRRVASRKYARTRRGGKGGWILRAEAFISDKYHLSEREHLERTRAWG